MIDAFHWLKIDHFAMNKKLTILTLMTSAKKVRFNEIRFGVTGL